MLPRIVSLLILLGNALALVAAEPASRAGQPSAEQIEFFEKQVRPVLAENCFQCHGEKKQSAALRLDSAEGLAKGSDSGPVVVPGKPDASTLIKAVRRQGDYAMPPNKPLSAEQVNVLVLWVEQGAIFPKSVTSASVVLDPKKHWAFQPMKSPAVPAGALSPVDAFVRAKLAEKQLKPAPLADRRTLLRRLSFDLTGLPPTLAEIEAWEKDTSPQALEKVVDRLLGSSAYGERWARHWLDLARYADTKGYVFQEDRNYPYAYTYRDYVIQAFNADKPFDRFVVEQLAADLLPLGQDKSPLAAMGYLTLGRRFLNNQPDIIDDRIDVVTRGLMGLTVSCARCHDHKYDPIPINDYYSLYGVFQNSPENKDLPLIGEVERTPQYLEFEKQHQTMQDAVNQRKSEAIATRQLQLSAVTGFGGIVKFPDRLLNRADRNAINALQKKADEFRAKSPFAPPRAHVLMDSAQISEPVVFLRGNPGNRGARVPRQMPGITVGGKPTPFKQGSGRLELAQAIVSPSNPLTARVYVNRVWSHLFGNGLVRTPSDFGLRSDPPTHPELLDWLALQFIQDGWSTKKLIRRIVLSQTYQQVSTADEALMRIDPDNFWLARQTRKRLEFEPMRDSFLFVAGILDRRMGGKPDDLFQQPFTKRRSVYGFIERQNLPGTFRAFDLASPDQHTPQRYQTTTPQQALFLLNSPFLAELSRAATLRTEVQQASTTSAKIEALYRAVLARTPTPEERTLATDFLRDAKTPPTGTQLTPLQQLAQVLLLSNEFLFVD